MKSRMPYIQETGNRNLRGVPTYHFATIFYNIKALYSIGCYEMVT